MKYYQEIILVKQFDISSYFIWSKMYMQLHLALVEYMKLLHPDLEEAKDKFNYVDVGVSFPEYNSTHLGNKLRLFAKDEQILKQLNIDNRLKHLKDYIHITTIRNITKDIKKYAIFSRKHVKTNADRLARRCIKRNSDLTLEEAKQYYKEKIITSSLPFIRMQSLDKKNNFKNNFFLFIEKKVIEDNNIKETTENKFGTYGLSYESCLSSVPDF